MPAYDAWAVDTLHIHRRIQLIEMKEGQMMQIALRGVAEALLNRDSVEIDSSAPLTVESLFRSLGEMDVDVKHAFIAPETGEVRRYARVLVNGKVARLDDEIHPDADVKVCAVHACDG